MWKRSWAQWCCPLNYFHLEGRLLPSVYNKGKKNGSELSQVLTLPCSRFNDKEIDLSHSTEGLGKAQYTGMI